MWSAAAEFTSRFDWQAIGAVGTVAALFAALYQANQVNREKRERSIATLTAIHAIYTQAGVAVVLLKQSLGQPGTPVEIGMVRQVVTTSRQAGEAIPLQDMPTYDAALAMLTLRTWIRDADDAVEHIGKLSAAARTREVADLIRTDNAESAMGVLLEERLKFEARRGLLSWLRWRGLSPYHLIRRWRGRMRTR